MPWFANPLNTSGTATMPPSTQLPHDSAPLALFFVVESPIAYAIGFSNLLFAAACEISIVFTDVDAGKVKSKTPSQTATLKLEPVFVIPVTADTSSTTSDITDSAVVFTFTI